MHSKVINVHTSSHVTVTSSPLSNQCQLHGMICFSTNVKKARLRSMLSNATPLLYTVTWKLH